MNKLKGIYRKIKLIRSSDFCSLRIDT
jgi:hypothetical protein